MAILYALEEQEPYWSEWLVEQPSTIRALIARYPPNRLYRMADGQRVTIVGYRDDGTVTVDVSGEFNLVTFERCVVGVNPAKLVECDLPDADELVGTLLMERAEIDLYLAFLRDLRGQKGRRGSRGHPTVH